jgi:hypothetical protein
MPLILGANSVSGGYEVDNSLRFNAGSSDFLNRTPASSGNRQKWTFSCWFKYTNLTKSENSTLFWYTDGANIEGGIRIIGTAGSPNENKINFYDYNSAYIIDNFQTTQVFRDVSAWYHLVLAVDTTQATSTNRVKFYINGSQVTAWDTTGYPTQNANTGANHTVAHRIGIQVTNRYFNGYMSEVYMIDGQQLTPSDFGEFDEDTNIWKPIPYTGSFGTNGFYLEFKDSSALGDDTSGNGNDFTVNNLTSVDQSTDTCTNNFATMNPLRQPTGNPATLTNGNLTIATQNTGYYGGRSTISVSSGKWYFEAKLVSETASNIGFIGIQNADSYTPEMFNSSSGAFAGYSSTGYSYNGSGVKTNNNSDTAYGNSYTTNDIISVALDLDNSKLYFAKNGTYQNSGVPTSGATGTGAISITSGLTYLFAVDDGNNSQSVVWDCNFGSPPFTISSGNADGAGFGNFEYAVPSGYYALCTKNLADYG